jgi:hypothetical protein
MRARRAIVLFLMVLSVGLITGCGPGLQTGAQTASAVPSANQRHAQVLQPAGYNGCQTYADGTTFGCPSCDWTGCYVLPCMDCSVPVPVLDEGSYIGGGVGITEVNAPPLDPVDNISVPNPSDTGQLPSPGDTVQCVDQAGYFASGCGGVPGEDGQGIGVFYDAEQTCYFNFASQAYACFGAVNAPPRVPPPPGDDKTTTYCYDSKELRAQHWYTLPDSENGIETFGTYIDATGLFETTFTVTAPHASLGMTLWMSAGQMVVIPTSTSHIQMFTLQRIFGPISAPVYVGYALRHKTDSACTLSL